MFFESSRKHSELSDMKPVNNFILNNVMYAYPVEWIARGRTLRQAMEAAVKAEVENPAFDWNGTTVNLHFYVEFHEHRFSA
jgi:hypothetical protein